MKVAFVYAGGRLGRVEAVCAGRAPSEFFYGAIELTKLGIEVEVLDAQDRPVNPWTSLYNRLCSKITPVRTRGEHFAAVLPHLDALRSVDVVVATATPLAIALGWWKRLGRLRKPIVGIHCGIVNFPASAVCRATTRAALVGSQCVLFAEPERDEMLRRFRLDAGAVHVDPFGVDMAFWTRGEDAEDDYIVAAGNDGRRDYATLAAAARQLDIRVKIITTREIPGPLPPNVEQIRSSWHEPALDDEQLRAAYRRALAVVVPLEESIQPSGQSVALQAMACGKPVVLSKTRGLWTGDAFVSGRDCVLVPPGSADALAGAVRALAADRAARGAMGSSARAAVARHATIRGFAERLAKVCVDVVESRQGRC